MSAKKKIRNSGKTSTLTKTRIDPITVAGDGSLLVGMEQQTEISRADKRPSGRTLQALKSLIVRMESEDLSTGNDDGAFVTAQASRNARQFVDQIADEYELPKVAPDGDGGLVFAWEKDGAPSVVVGFADDIIFAVNAPGTSNSRHFDEAAYRDAVPSEILRILPKRTA